MVHCVVLVLTGRAFFFFLSFSSLNKSSHWLPICKVSDGKYADYLMGVPLHMMSFFSLSVFKILSLSLIFDKLLWCALMITSYVPSAWNSMGIIHLDVYFSRSGKYPLIISLNTLSFSSLYWASIISKLLSWDLNVRNFVTDQRKINFQGQRRVSTY